MWKKLFSRKGRCTRSAFWARMAIAIPLLFIAAFAKAVKDEIIHFPGYGMYTAAVAGGLWGIIFFSPPALRLAGP